MRSDWTDVLSCEQARAGARIERQLRLDAERWARLEAEWAERVERDLDTAVAAAGLCVGECA